MRPIQPLASDRKASYFISL